MPSNEVLCAESGVSLPPVVIKPTEVDYCTDQIEKFCKERAVYNEVLNASKTIEDGGFGALLEKIEKAVAISLNKDMGINIFENVEERINQRKELRKVVSTGWSNVDTVLGGGLSLTELMMISAASGGGKSIALSNYAIHMAEQGFTVLYVSLELSEELVADRFETMITQMGKQDRFDDPSTTGNKMRLFQSNTGGSIFIKFFEADVTNSNDLKAYLKDFHNCYGKYPEVLVCDYLDLLAPNTKQHYSNVFERDKAIATQFRNIGNNKKHPMWMATASQENRGAIDETDKSQSHIAGGLSKVNTVDVYISIIMTDAMRAEGLAMWKFLKTRSSDGVGKVINMNWDAKILRFTANDTTQPRSVPKSDLPKASKHMPSKSLDDLMED